MFQEHNTRRWLLAALAALATTAHPGVFAQGAMVGILEGKASLIRQAARFALSEGVLLQNEDIVETAAASFVQVESPDGGRIGIGPSTRLILAPKAGVRGGAVARLQVLQGWVKLTQPADKALAVPHLTPLFELAAVSGATIFLANAQGFSAFVESGSVKLTERSGGRPPFQLAGGEFVSAKPGDKPAPAGRPTAEFLEQMPRPFRDPLPLRAARFRDNPVAPKPMGEVGYDDIAPWLTAEPALRMPLMERWRPRLRDKAFRAAMISHLAAHPEWDPLVFPEKAAKKLADEKRARELKAAAAASATAAAAAQAASAPRQTN